MFAVAARCKILVHNCKVFQELATPDRPDVSTRAWRVCKTHDGLDMTCKAFFYEEVMNFLHPQLRILGAKESARKNAITALENAKNLQLTGVQMQYFSFNNGVFDWQTDTWYPNGEGLSPSVKVGGFHPHDFEYYEDLKGDFATGSWLDIPTPALDTILDHQQFPEDVKRTFYALCLGRMMAPCGQEDTIPWPAWLSPDTDNRVDKGSPMSTHTEVFSMAYGLSGTGKSELTKVPLFMFNSSTDIVGQLQNESNSSFPIQHLIHSKIVISTEMDKEFNLPPTLFNQVWSSTCVTVHPLSAAHFFARARHSSL